MIFSCQHIPIWIACTNPNADMLIKKVWWQHVDIVEKHLQQNTTLFHLSTWIKEAFTQVFMRILATSILIMFVPHQRKGYFLFWCEFCGFLHKRVFSQQALCCFQATAEPLWPGPVSWSWNKKIRSLTKLLPCSFWIQPWKKLNWSDTKVEWYCFRNQVLS